MTPKPPITVAGGPRGKGTTPPSVPDIPWRALGAGLVILAGFLFLRDCFVLVRAGQRAVIYSKISGVKPGQLDEGLHLIWPIVYETTIYNTQKVTYTMSGSSGGEPAAGRPGRNRPMESSDSMEALTSDGLPVGLDLSVRFSIDEQNVWRLHKEIGPDYVNRIVRPQSRSVTRMIFAQFPVVDVYSGQRRHLIVEQIQNELREKMALSYLVLDEVLLRDVRFSPEFQAAIEQKQVAQQDAQRMIFEVEQSRSEQTRKIIEAQGEASAIRKKADALSAHPNLVQYEYVQRLPDNPRVIVTDSKSIINLGDVLTGAPDPARPLAVPVEGVQP